MERKPDGVKKKVLGRGLGALLPPSASAGERDPAGGEFLWIPVEKIRANARQPRRTFSPEELEDLVASVREKGVLQPILVRQTPQGFELVAGERRLRAAQAAGIRSIPAVVRKLSDRESLEAAVIENLQRADLNAIELAEAYQRLMLEFSLSQEDVAGRMGKDRATVANTLRLLKLPPEVRQAVASGSLSAGHARALLSAPHEQIPSLFREISDKGLSVRDSERLCAKAPRSAAPPKAAPRRDPHLKDLEDRLSRRGGTKVRLVGTAKKGRIEVSYFSLDELTRLAALLFPEG
jgi:ParB family chromosome partitioning protein